jgi:hypothetical protein
LELDSQKHRQTSQDLEIQMVITRMDIDSGKINIGSNFSLLYVTFLDPKGSFGEDQEDMFHISLGQLQGSYCPPMGDLEILGST